MTRTEPAWKWQICVAMTTTLMVACGCGTTINRAATEQLLLSDAIDSAVSQINFSHFQGQRCYLDTGYIRQNSKSGMVNSEYVISSLRQQIVTAGALLQEKRADADIIIEPRVGALGTDGHEIVYGVPQGGAIAGAASALTNNPIPVPTIPEIALGKNDSQSGIAKLSVFAYQSSSRQPIWQSGIAKAESTSNNTWVLGAGPFQKGSVYEGLRFAGKKIPDHTGLLDEAHEVSNYDVERHFHFTENNPTDSNVRQANHEENMAEKAKSTK